METEAQNRSDWLVAQSLVTELGLQPALLVPSTGLSYPAYPKPSIARPSPHRFTF